MKKIILLILDIFGLYAALVAMLYIRYGAGFNLQYQNHLPPFLGVFALWLLVFYIANLYEFKLLRNNWNFYSLVFRAVLISAVVSVVFFYLIPAFNITPKTNLLIFAVTFTAIVLGLRSIFNRVLGRSFRKKTLIVGFNDQALELGKFITENPQLGYELKYISDPAPEAPGTGNGDYQKFGIIQGLNNLEQVIKTGEVDIIIISPEAYQITEIINLFYRLLENKISFYNLSSFYERLTGQVPLGAINQIWFLENLSEGRKKGYEMAKRIIDVTLAVIIGLISLIFYPFIILAIKLTSSGPIFYRQRRLGQAGKNFTMIKFRTMCDEAEKQTGPVWACDNDSRVTKVGKFLRQTRIDELPQVWNILRGQMSFVGPRAERPEFQRKLQKEVPFYEERYLTKPGLTGWAQINYRYGSSIKDAAEKLKYDLYYIKNRSPVLDVEIILKTIRIALQQSGQ